MKHRVLLGGGLTVVVGVGLALADGSERPRRGPGHPVLAALDANLDRMLSADEIANATAALLALDENGDGALSGEELRGSRPDGPPRGRQGRDVMRHDADGDGVVTLEEFTARVAEAFARIDANADGKIELSESEDNRPPPSQRRRGSGRRGGPRGGR